MAKGYRVSASTQSQRDADASQLKNLRKLDAQHKTNLARQLLDILHSDDAYMSRVDEKKAMQEVRKVDRATVKKYEDTVLSNKHAREAVLREEAELLTQAPTIAKLKVKLGLTEGVEELQEALKQYILQRSAAIAHEVRENNQFVDREVDRIKDVFPNNDNKKAKERTEVNFVGEPVEKEMKNGETLLVQPMTLDGVEYTALKIPASIKEMKVSDLSAQFMDKENKRWFLKVAMYPTVGQALDSDWLVLSKHNKKTDDGKTRVNIQAYNKSANTDVVRECLMEGTKPMGIVQTLVLREIIKQGLGDEYVDFEGYRADSDEGGYQKVREMIAKIDYYTELNLGDYIDGNDKTCVVYNRGLYRDKNDNLNAFLRGYDGDYGCLGGVASLNLSWHVDRERDNIGFRSGL